MSWYGASQVISPPAYSDAVCFEQAYNHKPVYGAGEYWVVRPLDVYGQSDEQAVQVNGNFSIYPWQSNAGAYNHNFAFAIVDKTPSQFAITVNNPYLPPDPAHIVNCPDMYIYQYAVNSAGYNQLNNDIHTSRDAVIKLRAEGKIAKYLAACTFVLLEPTIPALCDT